MSASDAYRAVRDGAGYVARPGRGFIRVEGPEAREFLHRMLTQDVAGLPPASGRAFSLTDRMAKTLAAGWVWQDAEGFSLETDPGRAAGLTKKLSLYLLASKAAIADRTEEMGALGVHGPAAAECLARAGLPVPEGEAGVALVGGQRVHRVGYLGLPGFDVWVPRAQGAEVASALAAAGAREIPAEVFEALRVEAGTPVAGVDYDESALPVEVGLEAAVSYSKGCYVGQEILERMRSRGVVTRRLVGVVLETAEVPSGRLAVAHQGAELGLLTSAVLSPRLERVIGLASLPPAKAPPGAHVTVAGVAGEVRTLPLG